MPHYAVTADWIENPFHSPPYRLGILEIDSHAYAVGMVRPVVEAWAQEQHPDWDWSNVRLDIKEIT